MGDIIGLLPMESKGNEKGRIYHANETLRPFVTHFLLTFHPLSMTLTLLGKKGIVRV